MPERNPWLRSWIEALHPRVIVEAGAHVGEDTAWMAAIPGCTVHAIEADPRNVPPTDLLARSNVRWTAAAVADREGEMDLLGSERGGGGRLHTESSSLRRPKEHLRLWPDVTFATQPTRVRTITLDGYAKNAGIDSVDLIWADVQGAEDLMVRGGRETLARTSWLAVETSEHEVYEGQVPTRELLAMLPGWRVVASETTAGDGGIGALEAPMLVLLNERLVPQWREGPLPPGATS